jgi:hypothetical protein
MFEICSSQTMQCKKYVNLAQTSVTLADLAVLFRPFDLLAPKEAKIFENQIILKSLGAREPKNIYSISKIYA